MAPFVYVPPAVQYGQYESNPEGGMQMHHTNGANGNGDGERLLTPAEVATLFRVDPKTVTRWAKAGKLSSIRTLGGHRRYRETEVRELLDRSTV